MKDETVPEEARGVDPTTWLGLVKGDWCALWALLAVAFVLRFLSPIQPDFLTHPLSGPPITDCVQSTPVDRAGHTGTLCGLAYPYQRANTDGQPPEGEVFDEIYFGVDAHDDLKGIQYFDPEPPFSKLMIAAGEWLWGFWRVTFQSVQGDYADAGFNTTGWRLAPAFFGTLVVPLMYMLALRLWRNRFFALTAGVLTCFDGMFFVQSRIGMIDMVPVFFILLAYYVFHVHLDSRTQAGSLGTLLLTGIVIGIAIASKWIALAALATIVFFLAGRILLPKVNFGILTPRGTWWVREGEGGPLGVPGRVPLGAYLLVALIALIWIPVAIYLASWIPFFVRGQFHSLGDLWTYQVQTYQYHANLKATHPYGSPWYSWPVLYHPVLYYYESQGLGSDQGHPLVGVITNLGNPAIWWASIVAVLLLPYFIFRHRSYPAALILGAFITQYLPWARITRVIFLYHMFASLPFMILALAFVLARVAEADFGLSITGWWGGWRQRWAWAQGWAGGRLVSTAYVALCVIAFAYFYPLWAALPVGDQVLYGASFTEDPDHEPHLDGRVWFRSWIYGNETPSPPPPSSQTPEIAYRARQQFSLDSLAGSGPGLHEWDAAHPGIPVYGAPGGEVRGYIVWGMSFHAVGTVSGPPSVYQGQSTEWLELPGNEGYVSRTDAQGP